MGKRERDKLEREYRARMEARSAVYGKLWETSPQYVKLKERLDRLNRLVSEARAYRPETVDLAMARFKRLHRRIQKIEDDALRAAGFTP